MPLFEEMRPKVKFGIPYGRVSNMTRYECSISNFDVIGPILSYMKSSGRQISLCPMFGLVPS